MGKLQRSAIYGFYGHLLALFYFFDLISNFQINWKESGRILKDAVKIRDKFQSVTI